MCISAPWLLDGGKKWAWLFMETLVVLRLDFVDLYVLCGKV
jgi:hypothetical protein